MQIPLSTIVLAFAGTASVGTVLAAPALAHHSFAMFDRGKTIALTGVVTEFSITYPHSWMKVTVAGEKQQTWYLEMGPPGSLKNEGWNARTVAAGDSVGLKLHPMKDGTHGGQLVSAQLPNGMTLRAGGI